MAKNLALIEELGREWERVGDAFRNSDNSKLEQVEKLAKKYNVALQNEGEKKGWEAGCPNIEDPLTKPLLILREWCAVFKHDDNTYKFNQFKDALELLDVFSYSNYVKKDYLALGLHGRIMFINIASKQTNSADILKTIAPYASQGILDTDPVNKNIGVTIDQIIDKYITQPISPYIDSAKLGAEKGENVINSNIDNSAVVMELLGENELACEQEG